MSWDGVWVGGYPLQRHHCSTRPRCALEMRRSAHRTVMPLQSSLRDGFFTVSSWNQVGASECCLPVIGKSGRASSLVNYPRWAFLTEPRLTTEAPHHVFIYPPGSPFRRIWAGQPRFFFFFLAACHVVISGRFVSAAGTDTPVRYEACTHVLQHAYWHMSSEQLLNSSRRHADFPYDNWRGALGSGRKPCHREMLLFKAHPKLWPVQLVLVTSRIEQRVIGIRFSELNDQARHVKTLDGLKKKMDWKVSCRSKEVLIYIQGEDKELRTGIVSQPQRGWF